MLQKLKNIFKKLPLWLRRVIVIVLFVGVVIGLDFLQDTMKGRDFYYGNNFYGDSTCNVLGVNIHGSIYTYIPIDNEGNTIEDYQDAVASEDIIYMLKDAKYQSNIKAIVFEVDSPGGSPVAGEEISKAIKDVGKPTIAFIRDFGDSAAYMAISGVDKIFASKFSDVGGIGVTMSYLSNANKNQKEGYQYEQLISAKYKDSGNPDKILTAEEKVIFMRDLKIMHENFVKMISENRGLPIEAVKKIADGSTVLGVQAKELGLIDEIGGLYEVENYLQKITSEEPVICWN